MNNLHECTVISFKVLAFTHKNFIFSNSLICTELNGFKYSSLRIINLFKINYLLQQFNFF